jgi:hypothetical protein
MAAKITGINSLRPFLWDYIKYKFVFPPQLRSLPKVWRRVLAVIASVTRDNLRKFWDEVDYLLDTCRVTGGTRIKSVFSV